MYTTGDFLIQLKNAYMAKRGLLEVNSSKSIASIAKILEKEGFVKKATVKDGKVILELKYDNRIPAITELKLISKPSVRRYKDRHQLVRAVPRHAMGIISTSKGIMTIKQAQKEGVGGELICQLY